MHRTARPLPLLRCLVPTAVALAAAWLAAMPSIASAQAAPGAFVPGRLLVMPRAGLPEAALANILGEHGGGRAHRVGRSELRVVELPAGAERAAAEALSRHPHVKFAEVDRIVAPNLAGNDPYLGSQWHLAKIGADVAWDAARGAGVTIAILDSGVDASHPDLAARLVPGWNFYAGNADTGDVYGHGTKVAGSAAAAFNNGLGVAGVAGEARIMPIRISAADGSASYSAMAQGITWAADRGARVANISYVAAGSAAVQSAAAYMKSKGGLVTTSAGNYGTDAGIAANGSVIPVSATDSADNKTSWSSYGAFVAVTAPGAAIYTTTVGGGYAAVSGTSFSSPITAGVIALVMAANPKLTGAEVERVLFSTAVDIGPAGRDIYYGHGRVDAAAAVRSALSVVSSADAVAPVAAIAAPLASGSVTGMVTVNVNASDNVGVAKVELRANGRLVATDTAAPFAFAWDSATAPNGTVTLVATAYDAAGNAGASPGIAVNVANAGDTTAPTLAIANPSDGATLSGSVSIQVTASDNAGVAGLRQTLYIDGKAVATARGGALGYNWNTRKAAPGRHLIQAIAVDAAGNATTRTVAVNR